MGLEKGSCWEAAPWQSQAPWILGINACPCIPDGILSALEESAHLVLFLLGQGKPCKVRGKVLGIQLGLLMAWESSSGGRCNVSADLDLEGEKGKFFHCKEKRGKDRMRL